MRVCTLLSVLTITLAALPASAKTERDVLKNWSNELVCFATSSQLNPPPSDVQQIGPRNFTLQSDGLNVKRVSGELEMGNGKKFVLDLVVEGFAGKKAGEEAINLRGELSLVRQEGSGLKVLSWHEVYGHMLGKDIAELTDNQLNPLLKEIEINQYIPKFGKPVEGYYDLVKAGLVAEGVDFSYGFSCYLHRR